MVLFIHTYLTSSPVVTYVLYLWSFSYIFYWLFCSYIHSGSVHTYSTSSGAVLTYPTSSGAVLTHSTSSGAVLTYPTSSSPIVVMYSTTSGPVIMCSTTIGPTTCIMYMPCRKIYSSCGPDIEGLEVLNYIEFYMLEHTQQWILLYPSGYKVYWFTTSTLWTFKLVDFIEVPQMLSLYRK